MSLSALSLCRRNLLRFSARVSVDPRRRDGATESSHVLCGGVDASWVLKCVCGLPFVYVFACALAGLLTVALQQNVCPFLSPLM